MNPISKNDYLPVEDLRTLQLAKLQAIVKRAYENVAPFRAKMDEVGAKPEHVRTLKDIRILPFSKKSDLRDNYPYGLFASPLTDIVRLHASSGTTGRPIIVAYTARDLDVWREVVGRALSAAGVNPGDILHNSFGYGLFTGGMGLHYGAEALGATVVPISSGNTERQILLMRDLGATAICCTPSYFLHIIEVAEKQGLDFRKDFKLRVGVFGAEPWTEAMRERIESQTGIHASDIYGLSEIIGPGVASECSAHCGLHVFEDHFYPEIIDPDTLEPLPDGEKGELVFTTLSKEAMPMIRYRTRDLSRIIPEPCKCGRTLRRLERIESRSDDMLIIRGVNLFPSQIEVALLTVKGLTPNYLLVVTRENDLDSLEVQVEIASEAFTDDLRVLEKLRREIAAAIFKVTGLHIQATLLTPGTLPRSEGKVKRIDDRRGK